MKGHAYVSVEEADEKLNGSDRVFVYEGKDDVKVYSQRIMVWHEIVNDTFDGRRGSYDNSSSYYFSESVFFPLMNEDGRLRKKEIVVGVLSAGESLALLFEEIEEKGFLNFKIGDVSGIAIYDDNLKTSRVFVSSVDSKHLTFSYRDGKITGNDTVSTWNVYGVCTFGEFEGTKLEWLDSFDVMWFSWSAFYQDTKIYGR